MKRFDRGYFDQGIQRKGTDCRKWDDEGACPGDCVPLWVADMDFACAPAIVEAVQRRAEHPCYGYNADDTKGTEALCAYWQRRHHVTFAPENTAMLPCVVTGLKIAVQAFTKENDPVAIFSPVYGPFAASVKVNGRRVEAVPLERDADGRYQMNLPGLEEAFRKGVRLLMLCNPHNPVSRLWSREELESVCHLAKKYDAVIVSDEIHADFVYRPGSFVSMLTLPEARERTIMLCAATKTFNLAGLQQASAVSYSKELLERLHAKCNEAGVTSGNSFAIAAMRAAYTDCDDWLDGLIEYLDGNRAAVAEFVGKYLPKASVTPIEATYLAWVDLRAYGKTCEEMGELFRKNGVSLTGGAFFGTEGEGFMRINFACPTRQLEEGIRRMGKALEE